MAGRSQRGPADFFPTSHRPAEGARPEQTTPQLSPIQPQSAMHPPLRSSPRQHPAHMTLSLPPLRHLSSTPPTPLSRRNDNPLGVHSILNPQAELIEQHRSLRRDGRQMETPSPVDTQHSSQSLPSISRPTSVDSTQDEQKSYVHLLPPGRPSARHILTPKSPSLHRPQNLTGLNRPTGTIDAHQSPFLTGNFRPSEASNPPLPTPPAGSRVSYFPPPITSTPNSNNLRTDTRRSSSHFVPSGSASPATQYSPYSQSASIASGYESHGRKTHYAHISHDAHQIRHPQEMERNMIPVAPSGQSSIQMMTIKSQQGHNVQIPVDVQAASKVADEKRKRNAGASARFRARRKEREREASMSISRLEQQVRDAMERADHYRSERDFFRSIVHQQPGAERHYARPQSPIMRRLSSAPSRATSSLNDAGSDGSYGEYEDDNHETDRNVRRRTGHYQPLSALPSTDASASPFAASDYTSPHGSVSRERRYPSHDHTNLPALQQHCMMERSSYRESFL